MARARGIKPGFFKNEQLVELPFSTRLLFAGLWLLADREGRLEDRPKRIKMEIFPADNVDVEKGLQELSGEFILRYRNEDGQFIQILNFAKHQTPHYSEKKSVIKPPSFQENGGHHDGGDSGNSPPIKPPSIPESGGSSPVAPPPDSLTLRPSDSPTVRLLTPDSPTPDYPTPGKSKSTRASRATRKTPLPPGFQVSQRVIDWAVEHDFHYIDKHFAHFVSKAKAKGYTYVDWDEALMCAIRDDWAGLRSGRGSVSDRNSQAAEEWLRGGERVVGSS